MNFGAFIGKCDKCGEVGELYEELIPINEESDSELNELFSIKNSKGQEFKIGRMLCRECSKEEPRSILNR